ncbi:uncharacterized protein SPSK_06820 [Sporothrix schenckii 1099-18]|uniref:Uncharacterized protein n=1 Tax=Sporothrix schenckii 1099-18 TaxID=1397361 RepID=A0A0F2MJA4_SPOSC|nr:uncharacterized protein SPSK_06820 [Sporothrix schenckii 1099-18]KJR89783.1 hypothetical protein SPSK_06820 [Sporothrix schenckii 1099-18]
MSVNFTALIALAMPFAQAMPGVVILDAANNALSSNGEAGMAGKAGRIGMNVVVCHTRVQFLILLAYCCGVR